MAHAIFIQYKLHFYMYFILHEKFIHPCTTCIKTDKKFNKSVFTFI
jgi:hypothetical protein